MPVIAESGPYFQEASVETLSIEVPGSWLGQMFIDQILPHGYAFAQISVSGTGHSNHCMDLMGNAGRLGNDAAVRWLGEQRLVKRRRRLDWKVVRRQHTVASGHVWFRARLPQDHRAHFWVDWRKGENHVEETVPRKARAPIMHNGVYGSYGIDGDEEDIQNMCPDYMIGPGTGVKLPVWFRGGRHLLGRTLLPRSCP